jgi:hypothetical protein
VLALIYLFKSKVSAIGLSPAARRCRHYLGWHPVELCTALICVVVIWHSVPSLNHRRSFGTARFASLVFFIQCLFSTIDGAVGGLVLGVWIPLRLQILQAEWMWFMIVV